MREFWLMARQEYRHRVQQRSFLVGTLGLPLFMGVLMAAIIMVSLAQSDRRPIGYVDQAGVLAPGISLDSARAGGDISLRAFDDEPAARVALTAGEIQAFYVLPPDYRQRREVTLYYWDRVPDDVVQTGFDRTLRANLLAGHPLAERPWALKGPELIIRPVSGDHEISLANIANVVLPFVVAFFFFFIVMSSSGYMLEVVADEKENRTIEIMITTMTPEQLIGGKALGLIGVALTQLAVWGAFAVVGVIIGARFVPQLQVIRVPWDLLLVAGLYFLPAYALISSLMIAIGGVVTELRQGQQIAGLLNLFFIVPFFGLALLFINPDSPLLVALTIFPTTSLLMILLRWSVTTIPLWQLLLSWTLTTGAAVLSLWAAARIFRFGMLRYGQRLSLREIGTALKEKPGTEETGR